MTCEAVSFLDLQYSEYENCFETKVDDVIFTSYEWIKCMDGFEGYKAECIVLKEGDTILGFLPYFLRKKYGVLICESMLFSLYGGIFPEDKSDIMVTYLEKYISSISKLYCIRLYFEQKIGDVCKQKLSASGFVVSTGKAAIVNLKNNSSELLMTYKHSTRKNIKKAIRENVIISDVENEKELYEFYKMAKYIYEFHKSKMPYSFDLYKLIYRNLVNTGLAKIRIAKHEGLIIAGSIHFYSKNKKSVLNWLTPSYREYQQYRANTLLIHDAIDCAQKEGYDWYNLGASPEGESGLLRFKHNWGAVDKEYTICQKQSAILEIYDRVKRFF